MSLADCRRPRRRGLACIGSALALGICLLGGACGYNDTRDLAPASPDTPWRIETTSALIGPDRHAADPRTDAGVPHVPAPRFVVPHDPALPWPDPPATIDTAHVYDLAELIDVAERRNRTTRIAWEQARQAAIGVGIARAAYLPTLTASALGGYQRAASPFPTDLVPRGYITADAREIFPELTIRYLLLDFGARAAATRAASERSFTANVAFTGAHQALILKVAEAYFTLDGVDAALRGSRQTLSSDLLLLQSAEAQQANGLGTVVETALAQRGAAQARYDVAAAEAAQHEARYALLSAMDLPPNAVLAVVDSSNRPLPRQTGATIDALMQAALSRRPDLLADLARLRAAEADIAAARAEMDPKLSVSANVQGNLGEISVDGRPYQGVEQPQAGLFLRFDWPLYQGGLLRNHLRLAQSQAAAAEDALSEGSERAMREVALARDRIETGLSEYDASMALEAAAQHAADSASDAYRHGVGTFTDASSTLSALAAARASVARAHAQSLIDAASLAYATGALTSSAAPALGDSQGSP